MKICLAVDMQRTFKGISLKAALLGRSLIDCGHRVELICLDRRPGEMAAPCIPDPAWQLDRYQLKFRRIPFTAEDMSGFFAQNKGRFEIVHFYGDLVFSPVVSILNQEKIPVVLTPTVLKSKSRGFMAETVNGRPYFSSIDCFTAVSEPVLQNMLASPAYDGKPLRAVKLVNAVDTDLFYPLKTGAEKERLKRELGFSVRDRLVVYTGRFQYRKGADIMIEVWPKVRKAVPNALLVVIGSVCTLCEKTDACRPLGKKNLPEAGGSVTRKFAGLLEKQAGIKFMGKRGRVEKYLQAADLFFFPARRDYMPYAVLEAMSCGLACVTSGIKEITDDLITGDRVGLAVSGTGTDDYADTLIRLLNNQEERSRIGRKARERIVEKFSLSRNLERHLELYRKLIESKKNEHLHCG